MKHKKVVGFDFWTTNSTMWIADDKWVALLQLGEDKIETRTAIYYHVSKDVFTTWDQAIVDFKENPKWRLFQSVKSGLNATNEIKTLLRPGKAIKLTQIVQEIISQFKLKIENILQEEVDSVVIWRPVKFHDEDNGRDELAQNRLEKSAQLAWFKNIIFEYEPNAALRSHVSNNWSFGNVLVVDVGGGTSDFSVVNIENNKKFKILSNNGIYIGGNILDHVLSNQYFAKFLGRNSTYNSYDKVLSVPSTHYDIISDWKNLHMISTYKNINRIRSYLNFSNSQKEYWRLLEIAKDNLKGYDYLDNVEYAKRELSFNHEIFWSLENFKEPFIYELNRTRFNEIIDSNVQKIKEAALETIKQSWLKNDQIETVFFTWWSSTIPYFQQQILDLFSTDPAIVRWDMFNSVWYGLTDIAREKFL